MDCERCSVSCELCPADYPWNEEYWICPNCESTYVKEKNDRANNSHSIKKTYP